MSAQDYWNSGSGQQQNYQQGYGNAPSQYDNHQPYSAGQTTNNPSDPYGYYSNNQHTQQQGYNQSHNPAPYQQSTYQYSETHYQSQNHPQDGYGGPPPQEYHQQPNDGRYSPNPQAYDQNRQYGQDPGAYSHQGYNDGYNSQNQPYPAQTGIGTDQVGPNEKGLLGAIGGGIAGGYAGHKVNHGFIGAVGGAYAGHKLEDAMKDKKKKKKEHKHKHDGQSHHGHGRRNSKSSSSSSSSDSSDDEKKKKKKHGKYAAGAVAVGAGGYAHHQHAQHHGQSRDMMAGNFSSSCTNITIDRDYDLIASCGTVSGHSRLSSIKLNDCLTNSWGELKWAKGGNFGPSARNVRLADNGRVLEAELGDGRGGWKRTYIRLDERISNNDGDLIFLH